MSGNIPDPRADHGDGREELARTPTNSTSQSLPGQIRDHELATNTTPSSVHGHHATSEKATANSEKQGKWRKTQQLEELRDRYQDGASMVRRLGVTFDNLTVRGSNTGILYNETFLSQFKPGFLSKPAGGAKPAASQVILDRVHGCVKPGEMLLVLGRPDSGCTTLLSMLSNRRNGYGQIEGDVHFGSLDHQQAQEHRGIIMMNTEEEVFFPSLTVGQTMDFATRLKVAAKLPHGCQTAQEAAEMEKSFYLDALGISHTEQTKVGNEYVRGVSGGERKRVSIIECMAARASVYCWDNSTRGLDASTALEWTKAIRAMTDVLGLSTIVTLYQAGNGIFEQFDKVLVLDGGVEMFYGPREEAVPFMNSLGFFCDPAANKADFLTGVCVPTERKIIPGFENRFPRTPAQIRDAYEQSHIAAAMRSEYSYPLSQEAQENTQRTVQVRTEERDSSLPAHSPLTTPWTSQVMACVVRQYQILWGDKSTLIIKQAAALLQALVIGSLFYNAPDTSAGLFLKGGALFFAVLYNSMTAMSEVTDSFTGRPVMAKHRAFALFHPSALCIAQIAADIPIILFTITHFGIILYFMVGLESSAGAFFTFYAVVFSITMCITALFRAIGAGFSDFQAAAKISGLAMTVLIMYTGYMIHKPDMKHWFVWLYWIDPLAYAFESIMANEFRGKVIECVGHNIVPSGPGYEDRRFASCAGIGGAPRGNTSLTGEQYLHSLAYADGHLWRNFGIVWAWWVFLVAITVFFTCRWQLAGDGGRKLLVPRERQHLVHQRLKLNQDPEAAMTTAEKDAAAATSGAATEGGAAADNDLSSQLNRNTSIFTWKNLTYTVKTPGGDRILLDNVQGYVKPGMLGALMGSSGAGKTTLLDVLAQRKTDGTIQGSILVDGRPLSVSFQRSAGYCEQLDVHEAYATVREALEFSAILRQPRDVPRAEKLRYVDTIIDLLELHDLEHTLIGRVGSGLNVEQRKRVTIGVELVAKPSILIFLDEPTSGLDGQASYNTVRFLRKLADVGQAVLVTIHQPSAQLFAQFDSLLLLARGGKTVYFGDIGDNAATIKDYFGRNGAPCPEGVNPAEYMIDVVSGEASQGKDWNQVWLASEEHARVSARIDEMIAEAAAKPPGYTEDGYEFATSYWEQTKVVTRRMNISLYRNTDYLNNKVALHIFSALFVGFSFYQLGDGVGDQQLKLFAIFNFIFVAPGVIAQLQPLFIERRSIYEQREKKGKMYHWGPFVTALIVSEIPYLIICGLFYFFCYYYTVGFPTASKSAASVVFVMIFYEMLYTGIGQMIAAYAPNPVFASLVNPLFIGVMVSFCGVLVPYSQITAFWRYWIYYINPFSYLMGSLMAFTMWDSDVHCKPDELAYFNPPANQTCRQYLSGFLARDPAANLLNPDATSQCQVCSYTRGSDFLRTVNINAYGYGWRDAGIVVLFVCSSYALVYGMMKLRTKRSKKAE
ncbi:uncharacterized protein PFL1_01492 [Pseudozyma flocculosa PF-1]|uniref:uncharacterized protein n=1 Tax=Pseudozyma flocculosa PF-1 TaxID=1277687 RepID=UPI0004560497|nr:uncharacterized protein PFL1_01492 [Pseudozyma flocculosa PF-1]EPQ31307.1 hypothetical protein PFL1_01492 [Pseudozyma flocculosa PF-1]